MRRYSAAGTLFLAVLFGLIQLLGLIRPDVAFGEESRHETVGLASWYGGKFQGRLTANGEIFDTNSLTAAHRTLPFGSIVKVVQTETNDEVVVRINDRGPFVDGRVIDLSRAAADILKITAQGVAPVRLEILHLAVEPQFRTIQLGAFSVRTNAAAEIERLASHGFTGAIETTVDGIHRVIVQGVHLSELDAVTARLAEIGYTNPLVRVK